MNNYKLLIQYDGTNYAGWQIQKDCDTIQQRLSNVIGLLLKEKITLTGSGRTDSGVHALGQVGNFTTEQEIDKYRFLHSLNCMIPTDIAVNEIKNVSEDFNARYDAKKRTYLYLISRKKSPFYFRYSYFYHTAVDTGRLNMLSAGLCGQNDFSSFSRKISTTENKVCSIYNIHWSERKDLIIFSIEADRYLHGMVRTIVGTLLFALKMNYDGTYLEDVLKARDREAAGEAVPAKGLFLYKVKY